MTSALKSVSLARRRRIWSISSTRFEARPSSKQLVLATGSLPKLDRNLKKVLTFRDLADVGAKRVLVREGAHAAVIGGGLLGIEAAYELSKAGVKVTLVHL